MGMRLLSPLPWHKLSTHSDNLLLLMGALASSVRRRVSIQRMLPVIGTVEPIALRSVGQKRLNLSYKCLCRRLLIERRLLMNYKIKLLVMAVMFFSLFLVPDAGTLTKNAVTAKCKAAAGTSLPAASSKANDWTFQGCWSYFPTGPSRAIYRDSEGSYYICGPCDSSGHPGSGSCSPISTQTLSIGYWYS